MDLFLPKVNSISLSSENKLGYVVDLIKNQYVDEVNNLLKEMRSKIKLNCE